MAIALHPSIRTKLGRKTPPVTEGDLLECFANRTGKFLYDTREDNQTEPFTLWFIAETDYGRRLKICFVNYPDRQQIKTAYVPNEEEERIYKKYGF